MTLRSFPSRSPVGWLGRTDWPELIDGRLFVIGPARAGASGSIVDPAVWCIAIDRYPGVSGALPVRCWGDGRSISVCGTAGVGWHAMWRADGGAGASGGMKRAFAANWVRPRACDGNLTAGELRGWQRCPLADLGGGVWSAAGSDREGRSTLYLILVFETLNWGDGAGWGNVDRGPVRMFACWSPP